MEKVSVIVPVYNAEKYIDECVESIVKQSYSNIEIILMDDGSKDNSLRKCKMWADRDLRIKVFSQENQGAAMARKNACLRASGDWICFVDADDYVDSNYIQSFLTQSDDADIVFSPLRSEHRQKRDVFTQIEYFRLLLERKICLGPVCKLIKRSLLEESVFDYPQNLRQGEDWCMNVKLANKISSARQVSEICYHYRLNANSLTNVKVASVKDRLQELRQIKMGVNEIYRRKLWNSIWIMQFRMLGLYLKQKIALRTRIRKIFNIVDVKEWK